MTVLTRQDLDKLHCAVPGCQCTGKPLVFMGECHPHGGQLVAYHDGVLEVRCRECDTFVASVLVAAGLN
jgi:hypothetical protein